MCAHCPTLGSIATVTTSEVRVRTFIWANFEMLLHLLKRIFAGFTVVANDHKSEASRISFWQKPTFQPLNRCGQPSGTDLLSPDLFTSPDLSNILQSKNKKVGRQRSPRKKGKD